MTKILQRILLSKISYSKECDNYQFGFKKGHSTTLCAGVVKQTLEYYASRGSHVFLCFVDFTKAFDRVNYWKLFKHLLDNGVCVSIVKLLAFWYSNQTHLFCGGAPGQIILRSVMALSRVGYCHHSFSLVISNRYYSRFRHVVLDAISSAWPQTYLHTLMT